MRAAAKEVPAPEPVGTPAPEPRALWTTPDGQTALVARDWADGAAPTYGVLHKARARHRAPEGQQCVWRAATAQETWALLDQWYHQHRAQAWPLVAALARLLDQGPPPHSCPSGEALSSLRSPQPGSTSRSPEH